MSVRDVSNLQCNVSQAALKFETVNKHNKYANPHFILKLRNNYVTTKGATFPS